MPTVVLRTVSSVEMVVVFYCAVLSTEHCTGCFNSLQKPKRNKAKQLGLQLIGGGVISVVSVIQLLVYKKNLSLSPQTLLSMLETGALQGH